MNTVLQTNYTVDKDNKTIRVERPFNAPLSLVWDAWTKPEILDQWWAPKPWKAETISMNFAEGGRWHYYMAGPEGEKHYCLFDYKTIRNQENYTGMDAFSDEQGNLNTDMPRITWSNSFTGEGETTTVRSQLSFDKLEDLEKIVEMGFKEGFAMGHQNLDEWLAAQKKG